MRRIIVALALLSLPFAAQAQTVSSSGGVLSTSLPAAQIYVGNAGGVATPQSISGDATLSAGGALTNTRSAGNFTVGAALTVSGSGNSTINGTLIVNNSGFYQQGLSIGTGVVAGNAILSVGALRAADGPSWMDLQAHNAGVGVEYSDFRALRNTGINGTAQLVQSGSGALSVVVGAANGGGGATVATFSSGALSIPVDYFTTGTIPTVTGTGTPTIATGATDTAGDVTGGTLATSIVISFAATKAKTPFCVVTPHTVVAAFAYVPSTTGITITLTATTGEVVTYHCIQHL